jgi:hypothetical protein
MFPVSRTPELAAPSATTQPRVGQCKELVRGLRESRIGCRLLYVVAARSTNRRHVYMVAAAVALLWPIGYLVYVAVMDRADRTDPVCFPDDGFKAAPTEKDPVVDLGAVGKETKLHLDFGQSRGRQRDEVSFTVAGSPPPQLEVRPTALGTKGHTIDREKVHVRALSDRNQISVGVCIDRNEVGRLHSGTYSGLVTFTDPRVSSLSVPIEMTVQARYLWLLSPFVLLMPLLALYIAWTSIASSDRPSFGQGAFRTYLAAVGTTGVAFGAAASNDSWGRPPAAFGLIASMYAAAAATALTLGGPGRQSQKDSAAAGQEPPPPPPEPPEVPAA